jgi:hypothetical protein
MDGPYLIFGSVLKHTGELLFLLIELSPLSLLQTLNMEGCEHLRYVKTRYKILCDCMTVA